MHTLVSHISLSLLNDYVWLGGKSERKYKGKKLERKSRKKKSEEKYKIDLKLIKHFYVLVHTHFIYFIFLI